jgi:NAD(P)-dependent dehydrogenase (short-subunit alcohol dehydrogenase family)
MVLLEAVMQILLTGGSGAVGKAVVDRLVTHGHSVRVIGRRPDMSFERAEYQACDINDYPRLREMIRGCAAVVHLAAIPNPSGGSPQDIFHANCQGSFNVFQAATEEGIRRVVQASSINSAGQFYGVKPAPLNYLPLDEEHPVFSTDAYSFSKNVIEDIGSYFWRREGISSVAYRLPYVAPVTWHESVKLGRERIQKLVDDLFRRTPEERLQWFQTAWDGYNTFRTGRPYETPGYARQVLSDMQDDKKAGLMAMSNRVNFFVALDERDSAQAIEKGLTASYEGSHTLFINDSRNWSGVESKVLAALFYPDVKKIKKELVGDETLVSIDQARRLIGFEPEYSFGER